MTIRDFDQKIWQILGADAFIKIDTSLNGLQIGDRSQLVTKAAFAVDACLQSFELAANWGAQVLVTHHGLFWGAVEAITSWRYDRIKFLMDQKLALCTYHLPLDQHPSLGNNAGLAKQLGLTEVVPFGIYKGIAIGLQGRLPKPLRTEAVSEQLFGDSRGILGHLPFGKEVNETVAIVSGAATSHVYQAMEAGIDLFITGDADHTIYHPCQETGINVLFGGHYKTETWGVSQLAKHVADEFGIETRYFDIATGL